MNEHPTEEIPEPSRSSLDAVLDLYKRDVDRTLLRENLKLDSDARSRKFEDFMVSLEEIRNAATGS